MEIATHHSNQGYYKGNKKSIFLAGPTTRNSEIGTKWRYDVQQYLHDLAAVLFIPEPIALTMEFGNTIIPWWPKFQEQVTWELYHLAAADLILFWIPREFPDHPALTTNVEFGMWYRDQKTWYGRPPEAEKCRYLDFLWEREYVTKPIFTDLKEMCNHVSSSLL